MSSQDFVQKVLVVPECLFISSTSTENLEAGSSTAQNLLHAVKNYLETSRNKDGDEIKQNIIVATSKKEKLVVHPDCTDIINEISTLSESKGCQVQVLHNIETFEETLLVAKKHIDELNAREVFVLVPKIHLESCQRIANLIYNDQAYSVIITAVDLGVEKAPIPSKSEEEMTSGIADILSNLPSSDGLPVTLLQSPLFPTEFFYHGYTKRIGGISTFQTMRSLNLCFSPRKKDTWVHVIENRKRLAKAAGFEYGEFKMPKCVHGIDVWVIGDEPPNTFDAMMTNKPGVTLGAPGADCQTMLFCDPEKKVVAAAHSGWKGTVDRIQQNVVRVMKERFSCNPEDILVSIGPSIGKCCYNVSKERAQEFIEGVAPSTVTWRDGVPYLDLWQTSVLLLQEVGIKRQNIDDGKRFSDVELNGQEKVTQCTQCNPEKFFSYRRDGALFGNQIGYIGIKER